MQVKTTFAGGNPFEAALAFMPERHRPIQPNPPRKVSEELIFDLLGDGVRRNLHEIRTELGGTPNELGYMLGIMARTGRIHRGMRPSYKSGVRPKPEFWRTP